MQCHVKTDIVDQRVFHERLEGNLHSSSLAELQLIFINDLIIYKLYSTLNLQMILIILHNSVGSSSGSPWKMAFPALRTLVHKEMLINLISGGTS